MTEKPTLVIIQDMIRGWKFFLFLLLSLFIALGVILPDKALRETPVLAENTPPKEITVGERNNLLTANLVAKENSQRLISEKVTTKGDELLVLVNKKISLPPQYEPSDLVIVDSLVSTTRSDMMLRKPAAQALKQMAQAAAQEGQEIIVTSAYRSYWQQENTFSFWLEEAGGQYAHDYSAEAGHSQHQLGTAVDFAAASVNLGTSKNLVSSPEFLWLSQNAYKFGFVLSYPEGEKESTGYEFEPWHWRFIGVEYAKKMVASGLNLEKFLHRYGSW